MTDDLWQHPSRVWCLTPELWEQHQEARAVEAAVLAGWPRRRTEPCGCWWRLVAAGVYRPGGSCEEHSHGTCSPVFTTPVGFRLAPCGCHLWLTDEGAYDIGEKCREHNATGGDPFPLSPDTES